MSPKISTSASCIIALVAALCPSAADRLYAETAGGLQRLKFNHPGLAVDLGVGLWAWPLPMDYDGDGDWDLVVACPDVPYNGTYFFENPGGGTSDGATLPVFRPGVRIAAGPRNVQVSFVDGQPRVLSPGQEYVDFPAAQYSQPRSLALSASFHEGKLRANQWKYADFDGDALADLIIGVEDWREYGWDNAFDDRGRWTNGPLRGYVYWAKNVGTVAQPQYAEPVKLTAGGAPIDVYGMPSPCLEDFDGDGDLDLICGEFVDRFTYFQNIGTRTAPQYAPGRRLLLDGKPLAAHLCMIVATAIDWDRDRRMDLVVGQEDGRIMLLRHTGDVADGLPQFEAPVFFRQEADDLKFGALASPVAVDWDGDGDEDIASGNTAGEIGFIENLDGGCPPKWAAPRLLHADGRVIRLQAGPNGSIQGPCEAKWGYTTLSVADWDHDGALDLVVNSIWGRVEWFRNTGAPATDPKLAASAPVEVEWPAEPPKPAWVWWRPKPKELVTQWRTTPAVVDLDRDGLNDIAMLDHEGYLAWFRRERRGDGLVLLPPQRVLRDRDGKLLRLNDKIAGKSGRRKLSWTDWDADGQLDLLVDSENVRWFRGQGWRDGAYTLSDEGDLATARLAGHDTSPTTVDWNHDGKRDLLVGAEDGCFYYLENAASGSTP
ncbi:MAG: hypothetical protein DCC67_11960 [Planctomycetota bacterium]|nr:MAG: hypothetical protein DCC67_11960 [Planctomycetota bacterium]